MTHTVKFDLSQIIDAIVDCLTSQLEHVKEAMPDDFSWFNELHSKVRIMAEVAKTLFHLYDSRESLRRNMEHIEYAQKDVLL